MTAAARKSPTPTPPLRQPQGEADAVAGSAPARADGEGRDERERRDIVSGEVMAENRLFRFVADPDGQVVPDAAARLPGRGLWVAASKAAIDKAVEKKLFSRAAKMPVTAAADLSARAEKALVARMTGDLGIARRSGALVLGFDNVLRALESARPPKALIEAMDGARDGKRKLYAAAHRLELECVVIETLSSAELGLALGRENVIHAAVQPGGLSDRLIFDAERLKGLRSRTESPRATASKSESK